MNEALFDTNILIDFLNQTPAAWEEMRRYDKLHISRVTWIEVMAGIRPAEEVGTRKFLADFSVLEITEPVIERTVILRRGRKQKLPDCLIHATALVHDLLFVTRNSRDFAESETVHIPYQI